MCDSERISSKKVQPEIKQELNVVHKRHQIAINKVDFDKCKLNESIDFEWVSSPVDGSSFSIKWYIHLFPNGMDQVTSEKFGLQKNIDLTKRAVVHLTSKVTRVKDLKVKLGGKVAFMANNIIWPIDYNDKLDELLRKSRRGELEERVRDCHFTRNRNNIPFDEGETNMLVDLVIAVEGRDVAKCEQNLKQNQILLKDFKTISELKELHDFIIVCGEVEIPCHKAVMAARSDILAAMVTGDTLEKEENKVVIEDSTPELMKVLVKHMYDGKIPQNISDIAYDLLYVAVKYQFHVLIKACEEALVENMNDENAISILIMVDRHVPQSIIRAKVLEFITNNASKVVLSRDMQRFLQLYPVLAMDLYRTMADKLNAVGSS